MNYRIIKRDKETTYAKNVMTSRFGEVPTKMRLTKNQATEEAIKNLIITLNKHDVGMLTFANVTFSDQKVQYLQQGIRQARSLWSLHFNRCKLRKEHHKVIYDAISENQTITRLSFNEVKIIADSARLLAQMMSQNQKLTELTLQDCGIGDLSLLNLTKGIEQHPSLKYLDLKNNIFEEEGLEALLVALNTTQSCETLYLSGFKISAFNGDVFANLLQASDCQIKNLELNETEVDDAELLKILEATNQQLHRLSLSRTPCSVAVCKYVVTQSIHTHFVALCLSHCHIDDSKFDVLAKGVVNSNLKYLNISWNQLTKKSTRNLHDFIGNNEHLEKLMLQHNEFGAEPMDMVCLALAAQGNVRYIDISANNIGEKGFKAFAKFIASPASKNLEVFQCRRNEIGNVDNNVKQIEDLRKHFVGIIMHSNLRVANFCHNDIAMEIGESILEAMTKKADMEEFILTGNHQIPYSIIEYINDECRSNIQIKAFLLQKLGKKEDTGFEPSSPNDVLPIFEQYDVSKISIRDEVYEHTDFMVKFIRLNKQNFKELELINIKHLSDMVNNLNRCQLVTLHLEKCVMADKFLERLFKNFIPSVKELRLREIPGLSLHLRDLYNSLKKHDNLEVLDLQNNKIDDYTHISKLMEYNNTLKKIDLRKNSMTEARLEFLWFSLSNNMSILEFEFDHDHSNDFHQRTLECVKIELNRNKIIKEDLIPVQTHWKDLISNEAKRKAYKKLNLDGMKLSNRIDPALKLIKLRKCSIINLSKTRLEKECIKELVEFINSDETDTQITELDLSKNLEFDHETFKELAKLWKTPGCTLKSMNLDMCEMKNEDLLEILSAMRESMKFESISVRKNDVHLEEEETWLPILEVLKMNCSLIQFDYGEKHREERKFEKLLKVELENNKNIKELIFPMIMKQLSAAKVEAKRLHKSSQNSVTPSRASALQRTVNIRRNKLDKSDMGNEIKTMKKTLSDLNLHSHGTVQVRKSESRKIRLGYGSDEGDREAIAKVCPVIVEESVSNGTESVSRSVFGHSERSSIRQDYMSDSEVDMSRHSHYIRENEQNAFQLKLKGNNLKSLDFLKKFLTCFPHLATTIDLGENKLSNEEMIKLSHILKGNKYIQDVKFDQRGASSKVQEKLAKEVKKNQLIKKHLPFELRQSFTGSDFDKTIEDDIGNISQDSVRGKNNLKVTQAMKTVDLKGQGLKDVSFIAKALNNLTFLEYLDLSDNNLGNKGAKQVAQMIKDNSTIKTINLSKNKIGVDGLNEICFALIECEAVIESINISENIITDAQLKILFALLELNKSITEIKYTLTVPANQERKKRFNALLLKHKSAKEIRKELLVDHGVSLKCWQKACLPYWLFKTCIHYKHEAFRFKYNTEKLDQIENHVMPTVTRWMYINAFVYYLIMFVCPFFFVKTDYKGMPKMKIESHIIYGIYSIINGIFELGMVMYMQKKIKDKDVLKINMWHIVELFWGQIARFDTYLCVCFLAMVNKTGTGCSTCEEKNYVQIPVASFVVLQLIYPLYILFSLLKVKTDLTHTQPQIERNAQICMVRENMMLSTVLDSFCIDNFRIIFGQKIIMGRLMAILNFLLQDLPQTAIHWLFLVFVHTCVPHKDKTVKMSLICSCMAIMISLFNVIMIRPNQFDPIILDIELKERKERRQRDTTAARELKRAKTTQILKKEMMMALDGSSRVFGIKKEVKALNKDILMSKLKEPGLLDGDEVKMIVEEDCRPTEIKMLITENNLIDDYVPKKSKTFNPGFSKQSPAPERQEEATQRMSRRFPTMVKLATVGKDNSDIIDVESSFHSNIKLVDDELDK